MNAAAAATRTTIPAPSEPAYAAAALVARRLAMQEGDLRLANAYFMLADALRDLDEAREEIARLRAELGR